MEGKMYWSELIWVGNTLLPRGIVWGGIGLFMFLLATAIAYIQHVIDG
jgi:hypothetical protein